jgi:hypothetical protein
MAAVKRVGLIDFGPEAMDPPRRHPLAINLNHQNSASGALNIDTVADLVLVNRPHAGMSPTDASRGSIPTEPGLSRR